ncbi:DEAD/DEAH box helicase domain protein [Nitzschia inconspicua]|uniref:DEAD/DEAH box helicase domain protein n=1 Tax=Nitzschia inconspicua TaxID=303405 RepID=A0A9K3PTE8_9STRA|nr:DEAD/DEAH box helicase domain protein [Nitzschia inconspicua]
MRQLLKMMRANRSKGSLAVWTVLLILSTSRCSGFSTSTNTQQRRQPLPVLQMSLSQSSDLHDWTIPKLKEELRKKGLKVSGKKQELIDRLLLASSEEESAVAMDEEFAGSDSTLLSESHDVAAETILISEEENQPLEAISFEDLEIDPAVLTAIRAQAGWDHPTPVQRLTIPKLVHRSGELSPDAFWCEAPTGSGKTAAYAIPLLQNLLQRRKQHYQQQQQMNGKSIRRERISALVLCPTRELAVQIGTVLGQLSSNLKVGNQPKLQTMVLHGGVPYEPQIARLSDFSRHGQTLDVLVATPGRLVDVLTYYSEEGGDTSARDASMERRLKQAFDSYGDDVSLEQLQQLGLDSVDDSKLDDGRSHLINLLEGLKYLVLDEADRLLGNGFQDDLDRVMELLPRGKHETDETIESTSPAIWMFSATFPKSIEPRLDQVLARLGATKSPIRVQCSNSDRLLSDDIPVSASLQKKLQRSTTVASANNILQVGPASTIQLRTICLEKPARTQALRKLLEEDYKEEWDRVLVFVGTRYAAEHVSRKLRRAGIQASELHGKLDQDARMRRLEDLKRGKIRVLLSTDVASRGIDISGLAAVVNYDLPRSTSDFVHRVGRTGRAGKTGMAVTFVTPADEAHMDLIEQRHLATPTDREVLDGFEPNEERWNVQAEGARISTPGATHSVKGLVHDRMFGGIKGRRKSKKDKLREAAARGTAKKS